MSHKFLFAIISLIISFVSPLYANDGLFDIQKTNSKDAEIKLKESDKHFNVVFARMKLFMWDEPFVVEALENRRARYFKKRSSELDMVFYKNPEAYGKNYYKNKNYAAAEINELELEYYKGIFQNICAYNYDNNDEEGKRCDKQRINKIFK